MIATAGCFNPRSAKVWSSPQNGRTHRSRLRRMERAVGFEPTQCQVGSLVPFRLATPARKMVQGVGVEPTTSRLSIARSAN